MCRHVRSSTLEPMSEIAPTGVSAEFPVHSERPVVVVP